MFREGRRVKKNKRRYEKMHRFFRRCFMKNRLKHWRIFSQLRVFFSNWRPSRNTVFYDTKATYSFFEFLFFSKKIAKNWVQNWIQKNHQKNGPPGTQNGPKIDKMWVGKSPKSQKMGKKVVFWGIDFWSFFWVAKKSKKGGTPIIDLSVLLPLGSSGGL